MGTWALGTKQDCDNLKQILEQIMEDFYPLVGDDELFDYITLAAERAEKLKELAK
jgi:hypothetical protein